MKLIFKKEHLSIQNFPEIDLPEFTVLTGTNGSGKTHLLQAIKNGSSLIEGLEDSKIVYIDYREFELNPETVHGRNNNQIYKGDAKKSAWDKFNKKVKDHMQSLKKNILNNSYEEISNACLKNSKSLWDLNATDVGDNKLIDKIEEYKSETSIYFNSKGIIADSELQSIFTLIKGLKFSIDEITEDEFLSGYYNFSFKKEGFLPQQIGSYIWDYYKKYRKNQVNETQNMRYRKKYPAYTEEEFIEKYGPKPWEILNKILKESSGLKYEVISPEGLEADEEYQLKLINHEENITTGFESLSSGEKTLLALASSIYKTSSDKQFPDILLLDEVDASLHPSMIKILIFVIQDFFLSLGMRVILVTHSPSTVALAPDESIFVMNKDGDNKLEKKTKNEALTILSEGFISLFPSEADFSISYNLSKTKQENILLTEGITDKIIIETAWEKLFSEIDMPFYIQDCFDAGFLSNFMKRGGDGFLKDHKDKKFIALFDFDKAGYDGWKNIKKKFLEEKELDPEKGLVVKHPNFLAYALVLPAFDSQLLKQQVVNKTNAIRKTPHFPIELFFHKIDNLKQFFQQNITTDGEILIKFNGDKIKFANLIKALDKESFYTFEHIFKVLKNYFKF